MEAMMESAVILGREASLDLCTQTSSVPVQTAQGTRTDSDWQIVSICDVESRPLLTSSPQKTPPHIASLSSVGTSDHDSSAAVRKLDSCLLEAGGASCTPRKAKILRSRRGKPKLSPNTAAMPDSNSGEDSTAKIVDDPVVTPMTVEISLIAPCRQDQARFRAWNPFALFLRSQHQQPPARVLDLAGPLFTPGPHAGAMHLPIGSDGPEHAARASCQAAPGGYESEPDIDAVMVRGDIYGIDDIPSGLSQIALNDITLDADCAVARDVTAQQIDDEAAQSEGTAVKDIDSLTGSAVQLSDNHVVEVVHSVNEKQQASILRGKKKSKKVLKAALRKEKFSRAIQKCDI